jgi:HK97 family phage prohead protease
LAGRADAEGEPMHSRMMLPFTTKMIPPSRECPHGPSDGAFEGYASVFGNADLARDVVMPGAFRDSLAQKGPAGVRLLWQHDPGCPIGLWLALEEDSYGLYAAGKLDLELRAGREAYRMLRKGALDGLSIGYRTRAERRCAITGLRQLDRIDLWEISLVTFPLQPKARVNRAHAETRSPPGLMLRGQRPFGPSSNPQGSFA